MKTTFLCSLLLWAAFSSAAENDIFHPPVQIQAAGKPIDVEREGYATPFVMDFDGDGIRDLLVGQQFEGRVRIYRNLGTNAAPQFKDFEWFKAGGEIVSILDRIELFDFTLVDVDGDGRIDLLTSTYHGPVHYFRRLPNGTFAAKQNVNDEAGKPLKLQYHLFGQETDAKAKAKAPPELCISKIESGREIEPLRNGKYKLSFGPRGMIYANGQPVAGNSTTVFADWDGDGLLDVIIGEDKGSVQWYRNIGTAKEAEFATGLQLVPPSPLGGSGDADRSPDEWGKSVKPCVVDWNGDGKLDLLLGDRSSWFEGKPTQTNEEQQEEQLALERLPKLRAAWVKAFGEYQTAASLATADAKKLDQLRSQVAHWNEEIATAQKIRVRYQEQQQSHGFVWLFLRK